MYKEEVLDAYRTCGRSEMGGPGGRPPLKRQPPWFTIAHVAIVAKKLAHRDNGVTKIESLTDSGGVNGR